MVGVAHNFGQMILLSVRKVSALRGTTCISSTAPKFPKFDFEVVVRYFAVTIARGPSLVAVRRAELSLECATISSKEKETMISRVVDYRERSFSSVNWLVVLAIVLMGASTVLRSCPPERSSDW